MTSILPNVEIEVLDGGLGLAPNPNAGVAGVIGQSSLGDDAVRAITEASQVEALFGTGPLVRAIRDMLGSGASLVLARKVSTVQSSEGSIGTPVRQAAGAAMGQVTAGQGNASPVVSVEAVNGVPTTGILELKCTTAGAIGIAQVAYRLPMGEWSAPFAPGASHHLVAGDLDVTLGFASGNYVQDDTWVVPMYDGGHGIVVAVAPQGGPTGSGNVTVEITGTGGLNQATMTVAVDDVPVATNVTVPLNGQYTVAGYCVLTLSAGQGDGPAFLDGDAWSVLVEAAVSGPEQIAEAALAIRDCGVDCECILVAGPTGASTWAALDVLAETEFAAKGRFIHFGCEARDRDEGESEADWADDLVDQPETAGSLTRVSVVASIVDDDDGRRNAAGRYVGHLMGLGKISYSPGRVASGAVAGVTFFEPAADGVVAQLDQVGYVTFRRIAGLSGVYVTNGRMLVDQASDYRYVENRRLMDKACREVRLVGLRRLHDDMDEVGLKDLEKRCYEPIGRMVADRECVAGLVQIPEGQDIGATSVVVVKVSLQPTPKARWIRFEMALSNDLA